MIFYDHFKYIAQTARSNLNARVFIYYLEKLTTRFYLTYMITFFPSLTFCAYYTSQYDLQASKQLTDLGNNL